MSEELSIGIRKKPVPRNQRANLNRARQYKFEKGDSQDISVSLMDMDSAIMYYFEKVIKPTVYENEENVKVPLLYASPERWYSIRSTGFVRDNKRQLILPVIVFRRTGMEKDDTIAVDKIDPLDPKLFYTFEKKYTDQNRYDAFSVQQGLIPQKEYHNVAVPDYMILNYDFIVYTHYIEQMNKIVERINWSAGSYWGEPGKMRFKTNIESFSDSVDVSANERVVKTEFSVQLKGYLIPDAFNDLQGPHTNQKYLTPKKLVLGTETDVPVPSAMEALTDPDSIQSLTSLSELGSTVASSEFVSTLPNSLVISQGSGITITNSGVLFDGSADVSHTISIAQAVSTTDNVQFNAVTASAIMVSGSGTEMTITDSGIDNLVVTGSLTTTGNLSVTGNATIGGIVTAQEFHTEFVSASIIYTSGSTQFGDTIDDTHSITGSLSISGSYKLNGYNITEISNDTSMADGSSTALVTENAAKTYINQVSADANQYSVYLRKQFVKISTGITGTSTASFNAVTASAPAGITGTSENDFIFFINGQYMEHDAITVQQAATNFLLKVNNTSIGYDLESDDEIVVWGKFNS